MTTDSGGKEPKKPRSPRGTNSTRHNGKLKPGRSRQSHYKLDLGPGIVLERGSNRKCQTFCPKCGKWHKKKGKWVAPKKRQCTERILGHTTCGNGTCGHSWNTKDGLTKEQVEANIRKPKPED
jgi:hypothetical protein